MTLTIKSGRHILSMLTEAKGTVGWMRVLALTIMLIGLLQTSPPHGNVRSANSAPHLNNSGAIERPPLQVSVEPMEGEFVVYEAVAPRSSQHKATGQIAVLLKIKNTGTKDLRLNKVKMTYAGSGGSPGVKEITSDKILPLNLPKGGTQYWHQVRHWDEVDQKMIDTVLYLEESFEPNLLIINLYCDGYDQPFLVMKPMKRHTSPVAGGSYLFPAKAKDLRFGEYWSTASLHGTSAYGSQLFAYDMGVQGWDEKTKGYTDHLPEAEICQDGNATWTKKNADHRIYGKPVYAMGDGVVARFRNDVPDNPMAWRLMGDTKSGCPTAAERTKAAHCELPVGADKSRFNGGGNYFTIRSGDELHGYAHLQAGSLNRDLLRQGARVKAGDYLGLVGNSGCSTAPHIHIDVMQIHNQTCVEDINNRCIENNPPAVVSLRPLIFHDLYAIDFSLLKGRDPNPSSWAKVNDQAIPAVSSAIWPSAKEPCFYPPEQSEIAFHGVAASAYKAAFDQVTKCGYYPVWVDGFEVNGGNFYNAIFRSKSPPAGLVARHKLSLAQLNDLRKDLVEKQGYRLSFVDSYPDNGNILFSCIFVKDGGARTVVTPELKVAEHEARLDEMKKGGWVPVQVSSVFKSDLRFITTLYEKRNVGGWLMKSALTAQEYDALFNGKETKGMELVHLNAYTHNGSPRYAAIWHEKTPYTSLSAKHKLSAEEYQRQFDDHTGKGFLTRIVTGYELNNKMAFEGVWTN